MTLDELREKYGNAELKEGFENFIIKPKIGKVYSIGDLEKKQRVYYINTVGTICKFTFDPTNHYDRVMVGLGNAFYDKESAKEEVKRRKVYHTVEKYAYKFSKDEWENPNITKRSVAYDYTFKKIAIDNMIRYKTGRLYFKNEEDIQKAIAEVGEEDFIRYYLGVEL